MNASEWGEITRLRADGMSIKGIAAHLGMSRNTVRRALTFDVPPPDHRPRAGSASDTDAPRIRALLTAEPGLTVPEIGERIGWSRSRATLARRVAHERDLLTGDDDGGPAPRPGPTGSVPRFATEFVGRSAELRELRDLLGSHRLVTLTGVGGVGKTRLAAQTAVELNRAFADGVRVVELASLRNPALLPQAVFDNLGLGHRDRPDRSAVDTLVEHVRTRHLLIVLDNCEHVLEAAARFVDDVLRATSRVHFLATSREVLNLPGERISVLRPLSGDAVELFESRARDIVPGFAIDESNREAVRRVCERLDGLPLAIELACARLRVLSVQELADRLTDGVDLLSSRGRGAADRHGSLQTAMAWSYELCTRPQQLLWARVSIFAGGFDIRAAESVCADRALPAAEVLDCLYDLVGKSVLQREESRGQVRFRILETIREFGHGLLTDEESERLHERHLGWASGLVAESVRTWFSGGQFAISERLRANLANVRKALETALAVSSDAAAALVSAPWFLWACGLSAREHAMWLGKVLEREDLDPGRRAAVLGTLGLVRTMQGYQAAADPVVAEALELARRAGDRPATAFALDAQGLGLFFGGDHGPAHELLTRSLACYESLPDVREDLPCAVRVHLGLLLCFDGRTAEAARYFDDVRGRCEQVGERWMLSYAVVGQGLVAVVEERFADAVALARESLALKRDFEDAVGTPLAMDVLGWAEAGAGSATRSATLIGAASVLWRAFGQQLYGSAQWMARRERFVLRARSELGNAAFDAAVRRGAAMTMTELMDFALDRQVAGGPVGDDGVTAVLSRREREVAGHLAAGRTNREIAEVLVVSHRTVEGHVEHILRKLNLRNRNQVAVALLQAGTGATRS
ncbi:LuxR C-terminal-related transcriptional regulator [Pseudonocardia ailaonensis]|uniref:LuxR C-terminal-related transcriptional regulator n=1 Tax=Pseudonocardia ailaonensis TaxID=367279 RepID=UPI0031E31FCC